VDERSRLLERIQGEISKDDRTVREECVNAATAKVFYVLALQALVLASAEPDARAREPLLAKARDYLTPILNETVGQAKDYVEDAKFALAWSQGSGAATAESASK